MDEISQGPKWEFRPPPGRWAAVVVATIALAAVAAAVLLTRGGGRHVVPPKGPARPAVPVSTPAPAPGTVLLSCDPADSAQLGPHWQARSLRAGPLWFAYGRQQGYVHDGGWPGASSLTRRSGERRTGVMIIEAMPGSTAVMKPAVTARRYFRFVDGFGSGAGNELPAGDTGFTFAACPRGPAHDQLTNFYLGFSMQAGRAAPVEIWPSAGSRPVWVIFTCPGRGCEG